MAETSDREAATDMRVRRPAPPNTCGGCEATWTGDGRAHCAARSCHRTFSGHLLFDRHRSAVGEHGACIDPATITNRETGERVMFLRNGIWCGPEMTDEEKAKAFGRDAA